MKASPGLLRGSSRLFHTSSLPRSLLSPKCCNSALLGRADRLELGSPRLFPYAGLSHRGSKVTCSGSSRYYSISNRVQKPPPFAFAFDIDGVLLRSSKPISGAPETLRYLQRNKIPFILLTNGGGKHEEDRVADLSSKLSVNLSTENFVQSHTPFQDFVNGPHKFGDGNVLVTGSDSARARSIAEEYGFKNVITPSDILVADRHIFPFDPLLPEVHAEIARPLPCPQPKIDAIFVFNDPRDWALDIQIITDLLMSQGGVLGTWSPKNGRADLPNAGWQGDGQPPIFFSNPDLFWSASYHLPRFGQGAFQAALAGIWREITGGKDLKWTIIGKPSKLTYEYAERLLNEYRANVLGTDHEHAGPLSTVYMVGDNPESDIQGANEFKSPEGTNWTSVLVRTGVWDARRGEPAHAPKMIVDDVTAAVDWALHQEGWR